MKALLALLAVLLVAGCSTGANAVDVNNGGEFRFVQGTPAGEVIPVDQRATAPEFSGTLLGGGDFDSSSLADQVAVLNFWGSWCAPCRVETPEFQEVYAEVLSDAAVDARPVPFPLDVDTLDRSYVSVRRLSVGVQDDAAGLLALVGQPEPDATDAEAAEEAADSAEESPPSLLLWAGDREHAQDSSCYLGHVAFVRRDEVAAVGVVHRLRLRIVNVTGTESTGSPSGFRTWTTNGWGRIAPTVAL